MSNYRLKDYKTNNLQMTYYQITHYHRRSERGRKWTPKTVFQKSSHL